MIPKSTDARGGEDEIREQQKKKVRRIKLVLRRGLLDKDPRLRVTRAMSLAELEEAYRLVHDVYVKNGYLRPRDCGLRVRLFEASPKMSTFIARVDGEAVGVISVVPDTAEFGLPSDVGFRKELHELRFQDRYLCEITNLAVMSDSARPGVFFELMRAVYAQSVRFGCDDMFIAISPCHAAFFGDVIQFAPCGDRRSYSQDFEDIVVGMRLDLRTSEQRAIETDELLGENAFLQKFFILENPFLQKVYLWKFAAEKCFLDPFLLRELFICRGELLEFCSPRDLDALRSQWGSALFDQVIGVGDRYREVEEIRQPVFGQLGTATA